LTSPNLLQWVFWLGALQRRPVAQGSKTSIAKEVVLNHRAVIDRTASHRAITGYHWGSLGITGDHWEQDPGSCVNDWNGQASIYSRAQEKILKPGSPTNGATRAKRDRSAKQTNGKSPQVQNQ